ncbi:MULTISPECIES: TetR/AcrR family transcriptional regulator [unclassified Paenibacillus]|uniref:TetR/AcrR family transcriptional regulator n=1 Tax=Paenibacillus provencensis TaxID=441151 RepID=A0ABW3Q7A7_9BACL|nr:MULTISPECIES: TetR/AcrR family transcriptional regulator [unclassified Paenibacillus]MCM3128453.1 TetR/AcrR family transcriptional regulator [Paenibacillus sp. MER 78]SFS78979.1 DNA-binding transcriptional regulator, AcrR family [Paenibacillus sp. 453mf]
MKNTRSPRTPGRPKQTNDQIPIQETILKTASMLFMENGYEPVSLAQIAKICNVTKASIYYHFTSKPELFKISVTTMLTNGYKHTARFLEEADTFEQGLLRVAEAKIARPHAEMETIMREAEAFLSPEQIKEIRDAEYRIYEVMAVHIEKAMEQGVLKKGNAILLAQAFTAMLMLGNREDTRIQYPAPLDLAQVLVQLFLQGAAQQ